MARKSLKELSKNELLEFIINYGDGSIDIFSEEADCVACGKDDKAKYWYLCDECSELMKDDGK